MTMYDNTPLNNQRINENGSFSRLTQKPQVISITSGKGGVGKTLTTVHFAQAAAQMGYRVLIMDADLGLSNVDVVLGLKARYNIRNVLDGHVELRDIILNGPDNIGVISSGSGIASLSQLSVVQKQLLEDQMSQLNDSVDLIVVDTGAGISDNVMHFNQNADQVVVVTTPEPHAMTDAYAIIKVLQEKNNHTDVGLIVNMTRFPEEGRKVHGRISSVARQFLKTDVRFLGSIPIDPELLKLVHKRQTISNKTSQTISGQAWNRITRSLLNEKNTQKKSSNDRCYWQSLLWQEPSSNPLETGVL